MSIFLNIGHFNTGLAIICMETTNGFGSRLLFVCLFLLLLTTVLLNFNIWETNVRSAEKCIYKVLLHDLTVLWWSHCCIRVNNYSFLCNLILHQVPPMIMRIILLYFAVTWSYANNAVTFLTFFACLSLKVLQTCKMRGKKQKERKI